MSNPERTEPIVEPDLPIIDPHHHVWYIPDASLEAMDGITDPQGRNIARTFRLHRRYLFDELLTDVTAGHNIRATVFAEAHTMYRTTGPDELKTVGEIEFVNGIAAMSASGLFGDVKLVAGIIGGIDLRLGDRVQGVLEAQIQAAGGRYRGIRPAALSYDDSLDGLKHVMGVPGLLYDQQVRAGARFLEPLGLTLDIYVMDEQLPDMIDFARAFPNQQIIVDHAGGPVGVGRKASRREELFAVWRDNMRTLATCDNVVVKVGGLGMPLCGFPTSALEERAGSERLADDWRPHVETCIELFGADRCMFESNYPVDGVTADYPVLWNALKRTVSGASADEKTALFSGTAARIYSIAI